MTSDNDERPTIMTVDGTAPPGALPEESQSASPFGSGAAAAVPPPFPPLAEEEPPATSSTPQAYDDPFVIASPVPPAFLSSSKEEEMLEPLPMDSTAQNAESPTGRAGLTPPPVPADVPPPLPEPATEPAITPPPLPSAPPSSATTPERTAKFTAGELVGGQRAPELAENLGVGWLYFRTGARRGEIYQFRRERNEIGRAPDCDVRLEDDYASSRHGAVIFDNAGWRLFDFASTNGTAVNGMMLGSQTPIPFALSDGDVIVIGDTEMVFKCVN